MRSGWLYQLMAILLVTALVAGCGGGGGEEGDNEGVAGGDSGGGGAAFVDGKNDRWSDPVLNAAGIDKSKTGTLVITATFKGDIPEEPPIDRSAYPTCHPDTEVFPDETKVNKDRSVPWVFCHISGNGIESKAYGTPDKAVWLDQKQCIYVPHVAGVMKGQPVAVKNSDDTSHNVKINPQNNKGLNKTQKDSKAPPVSWIGKNDEAGVVVKCEVHAWMGAKLHVMSHPFFATTDATAGKAEIKYLPAGTYTLTPWHETFKGQPIEVTIEAGKTAEIKITLSMP